MKSAKKIVLAVLMIAAMAMALCSCGGANVDGTYVVTEAEGKSIDEALKLYEAAGMSYTAEQICTLKLYDGSKFTLTVMGNTMAEGTYSATSDKVTLTAGAENIECPISGDVITISAGGQSMKVKKK